MRSGRGVAHELHLTPGVWRTTDQVSSLSSMRTRRERQPRDAPTRSDHLALTVLDLDDVLHRDSI